jgi:hypothetical protein
MAGERPVANEPGRNQTDPDTLRIEARREEAVRLRLKGKGYREIGKILGVSQTMAFKDVSAVLDRTREEADEVGEKVRRVELERLDYAIERCQILLESSEPDVIAAGLNSLVRLQDRRARFLGLDSPTKVDVGGGLAIGEVTPEAAARLVRERFTRIEPAKPVEPGGGSPPAVG